MPFVREGSFLSSSIFPFFLGFRTRAWSVGVGDCVVDRREWVDDGGFEGMKRRAIMDGF